MGRSCVVSLVLLALSAPWTWVAGGQPASLERDFDGRPSWVALDSVLRGDELGDRVLVEEAVFEELFDETTATTLREMLSVPESPADVSEENTCTVGYLTLSSHTGEDRPPASIEQIAQSAASIVAGVVIDGQPGFMRGQPGTLFELRVDHWLGARATDRGDALHEARSTILFFYGTARMRVEDRLYCFESGRGFDMPQVGRRAALFLADRRSGSSIRRVFNHQIVFETESGELDAPILALADGFEFPELLQAIEDALSEESP